ncbi:hypothetical protein QBC43DRAFT_288248 [Cladorrhinum sp. PSN259]|nr:hypothetical protein QBC43DRAFT_288248 [Cladorrhinum sp. PSN259]
MAERVIAAERREGRRERTAARDAEWTKTEAQKKKDASVQRKTKREARRNRVTFVEEEWIDENETEESSNED